MKGPIWITEKDVVALMSPSEAIEALRDGLREEAAGRAGNMVKTHAVWANGSTLHAIGAVFEGRGVVGTKTWAHTGHGAMPLLVLIDADDGSVLAIIEAFALGEMRTGGISGLATDMLAQADANQMAMIGAGRQSLSQIAAVAAVRPIERVSIWSPTPANREAVAAAAEHALGITAVAAATLEEALRGAQVVTVATRAKVPFLTAESLSRGVHLNAVGAITPERAEFDPALLERATVIAADSVAQARKLSRELVEAFGADEASWARVSRLSDLVAGGAMRPSGADLTVFKAMGMGISDLSLGISLFERAKNARVGLSIPRPERAQVRFTPRTKIEEIA